jgi:hypothetical protein
MDISKAKRSPYTQTQKPDFRLHCALCVYVCVCVCVCVCARARACVCSALSPVLHYASLAVIRWWELYVATLKGKVGTKSHTVLWLHFHFHLLVLFSVRNDWGTRWCICIEALRYKSEGRGFDSRYCHWNISLIWFFRPHVALGLSRPLSEMSTRNIFLGVKAGGA